MNHVRKPLSRRDYFSGLLDGPSKQGTADCIRSERLKLSEAELTALLERYSQSFNFGVEDLPRLIGAAALNAAARTIGPLAAVDMMLATLISSPPLLNMTEFAKISASIKNTLLPAIGADAAFLVIIFQIHLIYHASRDAL